MNVRNLKNIRKVAIFTNTMLKEIHLVHIILASLNKIYNSTCS